MKRKSDFFVNMLCIVVCVALVTATAFTADFFSNVILGVGENVKMLQDELNSGNISVNSSGITQNKENDFAPLGFGGGGYKSENITGTPSDIQALMKSYESLYDAFEKTGDINEQKMGATSKTQVYSFVKIDNKAEVDIDIKALIDTKPTYNEITKEKPYILVYHTHTTEGYEILDKGWYSSSYNSRTEDSSRNMVRVGEELVKQLEEAGFNVIHDKNVYDRSYTGAYSRSLESVRRYLQENPSIMITLDVHRDAIHYSDGSKCKPTAEINGKKAAQVMIITGCEGGGVEEFPRWYENLAFSVNLQNTVEESYNGLMRPIFFCNRKYNMNVTPCSVLLEFGTDANTLEEAVYSASLIGESLGEMLNKEMGG